MARKVLRGLELDIERARNDARWGDIPKLLNDVETSKTPMAGSYKALVNCEFQVELQFNKHKVGNPVDEPMRIYLSKRKAKLEKLDENNDKENLELMRSDAVFLVSKINFMLCDYEESLTCIEKIEQDFGNLDGTRRRLRMSADMFAIKGICLEELQGIKSTIKETHIIECYTRATDAFLTMSLMSDSKTSLPRMQSQSSLLSEDLYGCIGQAVEIAFHRLVILYIKQGNTDKAVEQLKYFLRGLEDKSTQHLRKSLIEQLINVLLNGMCEKSYVMEISSPTSPSRISITGSSWQSSTSPSSKSPTFVPRNLTEDVILLMLLKEALLLYDATSSIDPEKVDARKVMMTEGNRIYNLLTVGLTRYAQFPLLVECLERSMKLAFEEIHLWFQFGLALASARKFSMAVLVLKQCYELHPEDPLVLLHAAKICFNHLHQFDEGIDMARKLIAIDQKTWLTGKAYLALGVGCCAKASTVLTNKQRQVLYLEGIKAFEK